MRPLLRGAAALLFGVAVLVGLIFLLFQSGGFMHGDP